MRRKRATLLLLSILAASLAGCWDRSEIEENAFVVALGIDKGIKMLYAITAAIAIPGKMVGGETGGERGGGQGDDKPFILTTVEAPTLASALAAIDSYMSRQTTLQHTKAFFIGEDLARENGLYGMDELVRLPQSRRTIFYVVTKGRAAEFLHGMKPQLEKDPHRLIEQITYNYKYTGTIPRTSQIQSFISAVNTGYAEPITYYAALKEAEDEEPMGTARSAETGHMAGELPRRGGPNIELIGGAAFRGERMIGVLTGDEMRLILLLQDQFRQATFTFPDPQRPELNLSIGLDRGRATIITVYAHAQPLIVAQLTLEAEIMAIQSGIDYTEPTLQPILEQSIQQELKRRIEAVIRKTQEWDSDVIGFGRHVVKHFPTVQSWEAYHWKQKYGGAQIRTEVRLHLRRFGVQLSPPKAD